MKKNKNQDIIDNIVKATVSTMQEIPALFNGLKLDGTDVVRSAMQIAKNNDLIPSESVLRNIWYSFIKLSFQKNGKNLKNLDKSFSATLWKFIQNFNLHYADFNVLDKTNPQQISYGDSFGNTVLHLEKNSAFNQFKNISSFLGISLVATGGKPGAAATEYLYDSMHNKNKINKITLSDLDVDGLIISESMFEQMKYFEKFNNTQSTMMNRRIGPNYEHYTDTELLQSFYDSQKYKLEKIGPHRR